MTAARPYDIITFDCYGTLIDWEAGIAGAFMRAVVGTGSRLDPGVEIESLPPVEGESRSGGGFLEPAADPALPVDEGAVAVEGDDVETPSRGLARAQTAARAAVALE